MKLEGEEKRLMHRVSLDIWIMCIEFKDEFPVDLIFQLRFEWQKGTSHIRD